MIDTEICFVVNSTWKVRHKKKNWQEVLSANLSLSKDMAFDNIVQISISVTQTATKLNDNVHNTQSKLFNDPINHRVSITRTQISAPTRNFFFFSRK